MAAEPHRLVYYAFDLLHLDGRDLRLAPLTERHAALQELLGDVSPTDAIQFSEAVAGDGAKTRSLARARCFAPPSHCLADLQLTTAARRHGPKRSKISRLQLCSSCLLLHHHLL